MKFCHREKGEAERDEKSRFSEEEIIGIPREGESGSLVKAVSAKHNISEATYYARKRKYGGMDESEAKRLRALEEEPSVAR